ncbi:hypothetical protein [Nocardia sp. R6R-6]|uniref:hypothetical protein n=1 Tax=Nocardia sp. R6R-6 TaxID=3459303 RepID=UPI00403E129C
MTAYTPPPWDDPDYWDEPDHGASEYDIFANADGSDFITVPAQDSNTPPREPVARDEIAFTPPSKSSFVHVEIDDGGLPNSVKLSRTWKRSYDPAEYGASILSAYRYAVYERAIRMMESGRVGTPTFPSMRSIVPTLLQTRSHFEYKETLDRLIGRATYVAHGPGLTEFDEPALTVKADRSGLRSIGIDGNWAASVEEFAIAQDIVGCAKQIRAMKPVLVSDPYLEQESDDQLMERLVEHICRLRRDA